MGLLTGSASLTRFNLSPIVEEPDFDKAAFREIVPGSEVRESLGFVPLEPEAPYEAAHARYFFRVRLDTLRPDPTAVKERVKEMVRAELDGGADFVGSKKRKKLREMAEEELIVEAQPRTKIVECCIDGQLLYVGSTAKTFLGRVMELLRRVGVIAELKTPWMDRGDPEVESQILETYEPGESILGSRFLQALIGDREILIEPESGMVRLQTEDAKVTLSGAVLPEIHRYIDRGMEMLSAKLVTGAEPDGGSTFRFDALGFRVNSLRFETGRHDHWTELLDERLEKFAAVWELLERKYEECLPEMLKM